MNIQYELLLYNASITTGRIPQIQRYDQQEIVCKIVKEKQTHYIGSAVVVCSIRLFLSEKVLSTRNQFSTADLRCSEILLSGKLELISIIKKTRIRAEKEQSKL